MITMISSQKLGLRKHLYLYKLFFQEKNPRESRYGWTPLHFLARKGMNFNNGLGHSFDFFGDLSTPDLALCKLILDKVEDKNPVSKFGKTPLFEAAVSGNVATFKLFLDLSEDKNPIKTIGMPWTVLHFAFRSNQMEICNIIVENLSKTLSTEDLLNTLLNLPHDLRNSFTINDNYELPKEAMAWLKGAELGMKLNPKPRNPKRRKIDYK